MDRPNFHGLEQVVAYAISRMRPTTTSGAGRVLGSGEGAPSATVANALANFALRLQSAIADKNEVERKDACDGMYNLVRKDTPLGVALLPLLGSSAFDVTALNAFLGSYFDGMSEENQHERKLMVWSMAQTLTTMFGSAVSWLACGNGKLHLALRNLNRCSAARVALVASRRFTGVGLTRGSEFERQTLLGSALSVGNRPVSNGGGAGNYGAANVLQQFAQQQRIMALLAQFPLDGSGRSLERSKADSVVREMHTAHETVSAHCFPIFRELLSDKDVTREPTLKWIANMLTANEEYLKTMSDHSRITSPQTMMSFTHILVELALPIATSPTFDPATIPASYLFDPNALISFGADVERIGRFDAENPLPTIAGGGAAAAEGADKVEYAPKVHLFFAAIRAVGIMYSSHLLKYDSYQRNVRHPSISDKDRHYFMAECASIRGLLGSRAMALKCIQLLNGVARWLVHQMLSGSSKSDIHSGTLPTTAPTSWNILPQCIVDDVFRCTKLLTTLQVSIDVSEMNDIISLMLLVMGNSTFFPKPHTHALFPSFLVSLLQEQRSAAVVQRHPWFHSHIVKGCILCYIAMEKSYYEKVQTRYELSHCLKSFLKESSLCAGVRTEFEGSQSDVLERFSHMVTADVNAAVAAIVADLQNMNRLSNNEGGSPSSPGGARSSSSLGSSGNRQGQSSSPNNTRGNNNDGDGNNNEETEELSYDQLGRELSSNIMLFDVSVDVFIEMYNQFPKGVAQNLVAQQIAQMLARSITTFAGPKCRDLVIRDADKYSFKPRDILTKLVECLVQFQNSEKFLRHLCECGVSLKEIYESMGFIVHRKLVREDLINRLSQQYNRLLETASVVEKEVEVWNDAPDFALDCITFMPLTDPVAIPTHSNSVDDLIVTNRETLHHTLLTEPKNPYTKEYLDEKIANEFNARPDVAAAIAALKVKIRAWHEGAIAEFHSRHQK